MTRCKKTDGECIANVTEGLWLVAKHHLAARIDRLVRRRMAEAYCLGWRAAIESQGIGYANPYRGRREK